MPRGNSLMLRGLLCGQAVALQPEAFDADGPVWIQIAREGTFRGHPDHPEGVTFSRQLFESVIANFRRLPEYTPGPDGVGTEPVVPFDYEHASEMPPTLGSIPQKGAPAPAWALDLKIEDAPDGTATLWSLTDPGQQARDQIRAKEYRWTSVAIHPNMRDPVTDEPIGPYLSSIALTNHPFIRGMAPMAARAYVLEAETPEEALVGLRTVFGLDPAAPAAVIAQELDALKAMLASGATADGVDPSWMVVEIRELLGLRKLATRDEVLAAAGQILSNSLQANQTQDAPAQEPESMTLTEKLAEILRVNPKDELVLAAAKEQVDKAEESKTSLDQLMALFDSTDFQDLMSKATAAIKQAQEAEPLVAALAAAKERLGKVDEAEAEAEADAVVASLKLDKATAERVRPIIFDARKACIGDEEKLLAFRKRYPLPESERLLLTQRVFAGPNGAQQTVSGQPVSVEPTQTETKAVLLRNVPGVNNTQRAVNYLSKEEPGFKDLDRLEQIKRAGQWLRA